MMEEACDCDGSGYLLLSRVDAGRLVTLRVERCPQHAPVSAVGGMEVEWAEPPRWSLAS